MSTQVDVDRRLDEMRAELARGGTNGALVLLRAAQDLLQFAPEQSELLAEESITAARAACDADSEVGAERVLFVVKRRRGELDAARMHASNVLQLAGRTGRREFGGTAYYLHGRVSESAGEYERARAEYERARESWQGVGCATGMRAATIRLGNLLVLRGRPKAAMRMYEEAAGYQVGEADSREQALGLLRVGQAEVHLGRWEDAADHLYRALALCEAVDASEGRYAVLLVLGKMYLRRDKSERAADMLARVIEAGRRGQARAETMCDALASLADICLGNGDLAGAERALRECAVCCGTGAEVLARVRLERRMAELARAQGRLADAEAAARSALGNAEKTGSWVEIGEALRVLGLLAADAGRAEAAVSYFERAVKALGEAEDTYELARARFQYGCWLSGAGRTAEASENLRSAGRIFRSLSAVSDADEASRWLFRLEMHSDRDMALLAAVASLSTLGLDHSSFIERTLTLLREGLGFDGAAVLSGRRVLGSVGTVDAVRASEFCGLAAGSPKIAELGLCFPVSPAGVHLASIYLERSRAHRAEYSPMVLQTVACLLAGHVEAVRTAALAEAAGETRSIPGLVYRGVLPRNKRMADNLLIVSRVAGTPVPVLIRGESGTGKELVARALHESGDRAAKPFVAVNCAAMPENLLEAEFFGVDKGAATGVAARRGKLETADGGTVFLDEVGDMSPALQAKLLRVLQEKQFERVGGRQPVSVDIRVVAATNQDLEGLMAGGGFRRDLYYRLNAVELLLPPLRERPEDIADLAAHFIRRSSEEFRCSARSAGPEVVRCLLAYRWPGNVRELQNVVERAVVLAQGPELRTADLPPELRAQPSAPHSDARADLRTMRREAKDRVSGELERASILECLERAGGNVSKAADLSGYSRAQFYRLLKKHQISRL